MIIKELFKNVVVIDECLPIYQIREIYQQVTQLSYRREKDDPILSNQFVGLTCELPLDHFIVNLIGHIVKQYTCGLNLYRSYVNIFLENEKPFFHVDDFTEQSKTVLFYPNLVPDDIQNNGETTFLIDNFLFSVPHRVGRMVIFPGCYYHKANSFRSGDRYSIALKYV